MVREHNNPPALAKAEDHVVYNVVLNITVPDATLRVLSSDGDNYYHRDGDLALNTLFGNYQATYDDVEIPHDHVNIEVNREFNFAPRPVNDGTIPQTSVCDMWGSFLNIQVATLRIPQGAALHAVNRTFEKYLNRVESGHKGRPIKFNVDGLVQENDMSYACCYLDNDCVADATALHGFLSEFFASVEALNNGVVIEGLNMDYLVDNTIPGLVLTRRFAPLTPMTVQDLSPDLKSIKNGEVPLKAVVQTSEIRMELTRSRIVDPKFTEAWVLCRRMAGVGVTKAARIEFAESSKIPVVFHFKDPRATLLHSRFGAMYRVCSAARPVSISVSELFKYAGESANIPIHASVGKFSETEGGPRIITLQGNPRPDQPRVHHHVEPMNAGYVDQTQQLREFMNKIISQSSNPQSYGM